MKGHRRAVVIVEDEERGVALVRGWHLRGILADAGCKPLWSASGHGWVVDLSRVPDVCACCDYHSIGYRWVSSDDA